MLMAKIAEDTLKSENPAVLDHAVKVLQNSDFANYLHLEKDYPFVECSTFGDEIKRSGFADQSHWHYVNTPYFKDG